jgi:hypothetical protein
MPLSFVAFLLFLVICAFLIIKMRREWQAATNNAQKKLAILIGGACILAFFEPMWIGFFPPKLLDHVELPNAPLGDRLTSPNGRVFIISSPIARVQRYGPEGFELGFMYSGKVSTVFMSPSGNVLICTMAGALLTYSPDGAEVPPRKSCKDSFEVYFPSSPSNARVPTIAFNWFSALAVPLWHPFAAWLTALLVGLFSLRFSRRSTGH